ncbi:D-alanyl-D-alanine carboxypeptidase [Bacillus sp. CLL-7-23]|uniref:serine-type D-Ala-D-Ala carboxypeptidase n=1 Tax=Bacillus changyiensis TaxID=3004103 RepID=A0ABT4X8M8_9BACI|nr:D-alanyl-D-alanine carboxypeptidase family protein [Bacillus changyiensis]MDA7028644.1 D-alanyl-D-alanine carboxypeptidase [Bacillus changyiensis]
MKSKKIKQLIMVFVAFAMTIGAFSPTSKAKAANDPINVDAKAAIIVEASSGKILYSKNADKRLPIASMAKMMTEYLLLEAIKEGKVKWDQKYTPDDYVYEISQDKNLSNVPLRKDGSYTVKELYEATAIYSANAAAIALSEIIAGSESKFVELMNKKAKELGMKNYKFVNATGLENKELHGKHPSGTNPNDENKVSARDMALLADRLVKKYPEILDTASISKTKFRKGTDDEMDMPNWNFMLKGLVQEYKGVDGLKTGSTDSAGSCFTATAERNGMRVISVVLNAKGDLHTGRFKETKKMLDYAFNHFSMKQLYGKNETIKGKNTVEVDKGSEQEVNIVTDKALKIPVKNGEEKRYKAKAILNKKELTAPVKKDEKVGRLSVSYQGEEKDYGFLENNVSDVNLVAKEEVEEANWFVLTMRSIGSFFANLWNSIVDVVTGWF